MNPDKKIRHLQSLLYTSGVGTVLFSLWSAIRSIVTLVDELSHTDLGTENDKVALMVGGMIVFFILAGMTILYIYIGKKAMAVAQGKGNGTVYIGFAVLLVVLSVFSYADDMRELSFAEWFEIRNVIFAVIDVTSNIILGEVIAFSIWLKKLRRKTCR